MVFNDRIVFEVSFFTLLTWDGGREKADFIYQIAIELDFGKLCLDA